MSLNINSGIEGAMAMVPLAENKQNNPKWNKNNNNNNNINYSNNSNNYKKYEESTTAVTNNNQQQPNSKKWSNYKKNKPKQQSAAEPSKSNSNKKNTANNQNSVSPGYNAAEHRDDLIDSAVFGLNGGSSGGTNVRLGSKKTNLNHLLNFTYESSKETTENYYEYENYSRQFWSTKFSKSSYFSKEQFLQANCQFVVKNTGDYTVNLCDPDLMVDWEKIEEIHIESHDNISCPICLYPPQIGKIAKCGHIFNWSCILHYLSLSDKPWRKCPICFESIYKNDLKSVRINKFNTEYKVGDEISFNLMFKSKNKNSTLILPHSSFEQLKNDEEKKHHHNQAGVTLNMLREDKYPECSKYLKLHAKSAEEIHETILCRERKELEKQFENEKMEPEVCFVSEAIELLNQREHNLRVEFGQKLNGKKIEPQKSNIDKEIKMDVKVDVTYSDAFENKSVDKLTESKPNESITKIETEINNNNEEAARNSPIICNIQQSMLNSTDMVFFYQSVDGQRIYINQLNARCLVSQYSSFSQCPNIIKGKIIAYESLFMTEENRKRFKYLSHLPLHSEFKIVELDLGEPYVSQATLDLYEEEIDERKRFRHRKELREKRLADRNAASVNPEYLPHYYTSSAMNEIRSNHNAANTNIVDYSQEFPEASTSPPTSSGASVSGISVNDSSNSEHPSNQPQQISFAQMLKHPNSAELNGSASTQTAASSKNVISTSKIAWPTLESSANNFTNQQATNQLTSGWLTMAKLQSQQSSIGKSKKYQDAPSPWLSSSTIKPASLMDSSKIYSNEDEHEEIESMPAPLYAQSFFTSIDESLKIIDSKKASILDEEEIKQPTNGTSQSKLKKKKKTKQLLFSTSLNI